MARVVEQMGTSGRDSGSYVISSVYLAHAWKKVVGRRTWWQRWWR